jgi:hypothetical protein
MVYLEHLYGSQCDCLCRVGLLIEKPDIEQIQ